MKRLTLVLVAVFLSFGIISTASATPFVSFETQLDLDEVLTTIWADAYIWDFNTDVLGSVNPSDGSGPFTVNEVATAHIVNGAASTYAAPYNSSLMNAADTTRYLSVPQTSSTGYLTVDLDFTANYFGLFWGSIDDYNTISFYDNDVLVVSYTGADITDPANGNQSSQDTNAYVNFTGFQFDSFKLSSDNYAFEVDNIAVAPVPEPATILLMGAGLLGLVGLRKKFKK